MATVRQVSQTAIEDKMKDERFKEIMQSYGRAIGDGDGENSLRQQSDFDSAYE